jgi:Uma2 family endonuclease
MVLQKLMTAEEFLTFVAMPENTERRLELVGGEAVEVVSNNFSSMIAATLLFCIKLHLRDNDLKGYVTGADGGYIVSGERYIPDVAYVSQEKQPHPSHEAWNPNPPDLAVEVLSPTDSEDKLRIKVGNYLAAETQVWVVKPEQKAVEVYIPGQPVQILGGADTLVGGNTLPGLKLPVKAIFE